MSTNRRYAAAVFSDIHRFTEKMEHDEELMMRLLHDHNRIFMSRTRMFQGRIVKSTGDGFLFEFPNAADAVKCCLNIQSALKKYNLDSIEDEQLLVRIGIHFGEVIDRESDIFGVDVNIASRLEQLADPGGICISKDVYNSIKDVLSIPVESIGNIELKHIEESMELFKIPITDDVIRKVFDEVDFDDQRLPETAKVVYKSSGLPGVEKNRIQNQIIVLPFKLFSNKPEDVYLSEGFAETLIFGISREKQLMVYPLQSVLDLGMEARDISRLSSLFGANYVVRGVLQRSGTMLRAQIELLRTTDGKRLYHDEIAGSAEDIFELLNKAVRLILRRIIRRVSGEFEASLSASKPKNPMAGNLYLKGRYLVRSATRWDDFRKAISLRADQCNCLGGIQNSGWQNNQIVLN